MRLLNLEMALRVQVSGNANPARGFTLRAPRLSYQHNDCILPDIVVAAERESCGCGSYESCTVRVPPACISDITRSNVSDVRLTTSYIPSV